LSRYKTHFRGWLRAFAQASTLLGLAMIALIWSALEFHLDSEYQRLKTGAIQNTGNLARVFEDQIVRTIRANDRILRSLQLASVNATLEQDFDRWAREVEGSGDFIVQLSLLDANGMHIASSLGPVAKPTDLSDREHFRVHQQSAEAGLFISKPVFGRTSGKWSIQMSRAVRSPHGAFAGVVVASVSPERLANFYESVELGRNGAVVLVGLDGVIRASAGLKVNAVGRSMHKSQVMERALESDEGAFLSSGAVDGIRRLISYRVVNGHPLLLLVGQAEENVFATFYQNRHSYRMAAIGLTLFILIVVVANVRHRHGLDIARGNLRKSERLANEKSRELELTLDHMSQGIMMIDKDANVALMNRQAVKLLGLPEDFVAGRPKFDELVAYQTVNGEFGPKGFAVDTKLRGHIEAGLSVPILRDYERVRPDGTVLEVRSADLPDGGFVRTFTDISERKRSEDRIAHMALHDALTGLANRVLLRRQIDAEFARLRRDGAPFALLLIDLDHFKAVNDTFGHGTGDELLRQVAERLRGCVRETDTAARLGGDEFAVLQAMTDTPGGVQTLAQRIVDQVSAPYMIAGHEVSVGASIGVAHSADCGTIEDLFHNADLALYRVKSGGRNGYRVYEAAMDAEAEARRQMEKDLRAAYERGEFTVQYQPMFCLGSGKVAAVEALLRWHHPQRGPISPAEFIPVAEEIGLMPDIDLRVMATACGEAARWSHDTKVAVNLSPVMFKRSDIVEAVRRVLAVTGLAPQRLELEVSERTLLREDNGTLAALRSLRELGVRIVLDDFGTGYTSLSDLRAFSFDKIKIDQSFVAEMAASQESAAIVAAIGGLGHSLGVDTTAEGVETPDQAELVRAAGCTQVQGYLYSRPIDARALRALLTNTDARRSAVA